MADTPFAYSGRLVISIGVADLDAAIGWYGRALGFETVYRLDGYGWAEVRTPVTGVTVGVGQVEEVEPGGPTPVFGVEDIEAARSHLEGLDVRFDGETREVDGMVRLATFYDPDGNALMLSQSLQPVEER
jgi:CreA protein